MWNLQCWPFPKLLLKKSCSIASLKIMTIPILTIGKCSVGRSDITLEEKFLLKLTKLLWSKDTACMGEASTRTYICSHGTDIYLLKCIFKRGLINFWHLVQSTTRSVISYSLYPGRQTLIAIQTQNFNKVFQYILKSLETFFIQNNFFSNAKYTNKIKKDKF